MHRLCVLLFLLLIGLKGFAQFPKNKTAARMRIDAKRQLANLNGEEAIYRAREFIREDSTYYVGYYFEGVYKYNHAADYLGYKNAAKPLAKALRLISRDYARQLKLRTADLAVYYPIYQYHVDYAEIANLLWTCYGNINEPEKAFQVAKEAEKWNFQRDFFSTASAKAWLMHRNRFYNHSNYSFLKNSIAENEALALSYLDSGVVKIKKDALINSTIYRPGYNEIDLQNIYHYKALIYSYSLNIDSAMHYYRLMMDGPIFSYNNYANFLTVCGDFKDALYNYDQSRMQDLGDKRLQEWAYFSALLQIYRHQPAKASQELKELIKSVGSTPGFGWYNIALARTETYNGQIDNSEKHLATANRFKELNIGTTLGESQYEFSANLIGLMNAQNRIKALEFENKNWWYHPFLWLRLSQLKADKYLQQYILVNQLSLNPERDRVLYPLFSSESVVGWDEMWYLIKDFGTAFFYKKFEAQYRTDKRRLVTKYFLLYMGKLKLEQRKYKEAINLLNTALKDPNIEPEYEQLFLARAYEALAYAYKKNGDALNYQKSLLQFYKLYPQLVPYSDLKMNFQLVLESPQQDKVLLSRLKACRIYWLEENSTLPKATVHLSFGQNGESRFLRYYVTDASKGQKLIKETILHYTDSKEAALLLAYGLFDIDYAQKETGQESQPRSQTATSSSY